MRNKQVKSALAKQFKYNTWDTGKNSTTEEFLPGGG